MTSRTSVNVRGSDQALRASLITHLVPGAPINALTASASFQPRVCAPSISSSLSPGATPARAAGESSTGETTTRSSPRVAISRPTPPYSPSVSCFSAAYALGSSRASRPRPAGPGEPQLRVQGRLALPELEIQVRALQRTAVAHRADHVSPAHLVPLCARECAQVRHQREVCVAVVDDDQVPVSVEPSS